MVRARRFYIDLVRQGLESLSSGPAPNPAHPLHDPALWLAESTEWVFVDSGLRAVLDEPNARALLGDRLHEGLAELDGLLSRTPGQPLPSATDDGARLAAVATDLLRLLDGAPPRVAAVSGEPLT